MEWQMPRTVVLEMWVLDLQVDPLSFNLKGKWVQAWHLSHLHSLQNRLLLLCLNQRVAVSQTPVKSNTGTDQIYFIFYWVLVKTCTQLPCCKGFTERGKCTMMILEYSTASTSSSCKPIRIWGVFKINKHLRLCAKEDIISADEFMG